MSQSDNELHTQSEQSYIPAGGYSISADGVRSCDRCAVCGGVRTGGTRHNHELLGWKPPYDDFEGALEGYRIATEGSRS